MSGFPILDAEPSPRSLRRRLAIGVAAVVALAVIAVVGIVVVASVHRSSRSSAASTPTAIVAYQSEVLSRYTADGTDPTSYASLGLVSGWPIPSPDGKLLLSGSGQLVTMDGAKPTALSTVLYRALPNSNDVTNGFADGSAYVAVFDVTGAAVALASTSSGAPHPLGAGSYAIGDPTAAALYVTTPMGQPVGSGDDTYQPNAGVERRGVGITTTVVATASDIASRLKLPSTALLELDPVPDPTGRDVAVSVTAHEGSTTAYGLVVYTRAGSFVVAIPSVANEPVFWGPTGDYLLYEPAGGQPRLQIWRPGASNAPATGIPLPAGISGIFQCTWSPTGLQAMCGGVHASGESISDWVRLDPAAHTATLINQGSNPVLWVKAGP